MKFLLTSAGISTDSIRTTLVDLLGKPNAESSALCIPTAMYAIPSGAAHAWRFLRGVDTTPLCEIKVIDGEVSVVSEGHWKRFTP